MIKCVVLKLTDKANPVKVISPHLLAIELGKPSHELWIDSLISTIILDLHWLATKLKYSGSTCTKFG